MALAGIAGAVRRDIAGEDRPLEPKRFEEIVGFEECPIPTSHPLAIHPFGCLEFHGPKILLGAISIIISGVADRLTAPPGGF